MHTHTHTHADRQTYRLTIDPKGRLKLADARANTDGLTVDYSARHNKMLSRAQKSRSDSSSSLLCCPVVSGR